MYNDSTRPFFLTHSLLLFSSSSSTIPFLLLLLLLLISSPSPVVASAADFNQPCPPLLPNPATSVEYFSAASVQQIADSGLYDTANGSKPISKMSKSRVYADVNVVRPREYWDYEALTVQWG